MGARTARSWSISRGCVTCRSSGVGIWSFTTVQANSVLQELSRSFVTRSRHEGIRDACA